MDSTQVCILDYGSGNVRSVFNLLSAISANVKISNSPKDIKNSTHLILPGVGAFGASMGKIKSKIPLKNLEEEVLKNKKPFLGICVGMQVLADKGFEFGEFDGLGWISGKVVKIKAPDLILPHVGWNNLILKKKSPLTEGFDDKPDFYFVHSYIFKPDSSEDIIAETEYGEQFCSVIEKGNIYGVQFHPEKSQRMGKVLLENFLKIKLTA